jgi:hypothetical protein
VNLSAGRAPRVSVLQPGLGLFHDVPRLKRINHYLYATIFSRPWQLPVFFGGWRVGSRGAAPFGFKGAGFDFFV